MRHVIFAFAALGFLAACNTIEGAGRDLRGAGSAIQTSASKVKSAF